MGKKQEALSLRTSIISQIGTLKLLKDGYTEVLDAAGSTVNEENKATLYLYSLWVYSVFLEVFYNI